MNRNVLVECLLHMPVLLDVPGSNQIRISLTEVFIFFISLPGKNRIAP